METVNRRRAAVKAAFPATVPVMTGFLALGVAYGILMRTNGYGPLWSTLMSAIGFGGSMQYVAITLLVTAFDPLQAFLLALMVNARHMFYGLSLLDKYKGLGKARFFMVFALCDETFSLVSTLEPPEGVERKDFYFWITLLAALLAVPGEEGPAGGGAVPGPGAAGGRHGPSGGVLPEKRLLDGGAPRAAGASLHHGGGGVAPLEGECAFVHRRGHGAVYAAGAGGVRVRKGAA